jgi:predicted permease
MAWTRTRWSDLFAIVCIALGTASVAAMLALVDATLWRPLPFPASDRLMRVWLAETDGDPRIELSFPELAELEAGLRGAEGFALAARSRLVARLPGGTERLRGEAVDPDYFELLGVAPAQGRGFAADDFAPDATPTVLISHALWARHWGSDPGAIGSVLAAGEARLRIIGVMPPRFEGSIENDVIDLWLPQAQYQPAALRSDRAARLGWTLVRRAAGGAPVARQAELAAIHAQWRRVDPTRYERTRLRLEPLGENWRAPLRQNATLLLAAVFVLLAIAIANVAALLLARALDRRRELALRSALGAGRARLLASLLIETGRLALIGGVLGALAAPWLLQGALAWAPLQLPGYLDLSFDVKSVALSLVTLLGTALVASAIPAWRGSRVAPQAVLAAGARGSAGRRERRGWSSLIAVELALSFVLLAGGALLLRSYQGLASVDLGFRQDALLRLAITLAASDYGEREAIPALQARLQQTLAHQPGVRSVGLVAPTLPPWDALRPALRHSALARATASDGLTVGAHLIDPGLLDTLAIPLVAGRGIAPGDTLGRAPVALVSAALAQRLGGVERALGSDIELDGTHAGRYRIEGIVGDVAWDGVAEQDTGRYIRYSDSDARGARLDVYLALAQRPSPVVSIAVHTALPPEAMIEPLRRVLAQQAPGSAVHWISTMQEQLADEYAAARFYLALMTLFAATALLLAGVGLFALLSHALLARQREIGVRLALGADAARIARLLLGDGLRLLGLGLGAGVVLAWLGARTIEATLYGIAAFDPLAYLGAALLLTFTTLAATLGPLRRAVRLAPTQALQAD